MRIAMDGYEECLIACGLVSTTTVCATGSVAAKTTAFAFCSFYGFSGMCVYYTIECQIIYG